MKSKRLMFVSDPRLFLLKVRSLTPFAAAVMEQQLLSYGVTFRVTSIKDSFYCGYRYFGSASSSIFKRSFCCYSGIVFAPKYVIIKRQKVSLSLSGLPVTWSQFYCSFCTVCPVQRCAFRLLSILLKE